MKHSVNIISSSTLWFQISLNTGPADQMVCCNMMPLKERLEFRFTGHRTTEADCDVQVIYSTRKNCTCQVLLYSAAKGQIKCHLPHAPVLSWYVAAYCFFNLLGVRLRMSNFERSERQRGEESNFKKISFQTTYNLLCREKNMWTFAQWKAIPLNYLVYKGIFLEVLYCS